MLDFTLDKYKELCKALVDTGYIPLTVFAFLKSRDRDEKYVVLRHDVDRYMKNALKMAELEACLGIRSTYYFRYPYTFKPTIVKEIFELGHEIGYHYEVLAKTKGNYSKAIKLFALELEEFKSICDVQTICMHGSPLSAYDNRDLWKHYSFKDYGIFGEAYLSLSQNIRYFSDTGRSWNSKNNIRDFLPGNKNINTVRTTDCLIELIKKLCIGNIYILTHPERWDNNLAAWISSLARDCSSNLAKKLLVVSLKWLKL